MAQGLQVSGKQCIVSVPNYYVNSALIQELGSLAHPQAFLLDKLRHGTTKLSEQEINIDKKTI